jgi:hypothetical protein
MSFIKTTFAALAVASHFTSVLAAPTDREGLTLSIRAADIIKNDLSATEGPPPYGIIHSLAKDQPTR